jgi:hypothetical protein
MSPTQSHGRLRYIPLLAAGLLVLLGIVFLGGLTGLLWHSLTFGFWVPLDPSPLGVREADWLAWGVSLLFAISPGILMLARRRMIPDPVVVLTFFVLPLLSLMTAAWSYYIGGTLLVGSGFLVAYALTSRSDQLMGIDRRSAVRLVMLVVFTFLTVTAVGSVVSVLTWREYTFSALIAREDMIDPLFRMLSIDMEVFYLSRPLFLAVFVAMALASVVALLREDLFLLFRWMIRWLTREKCWTKNHESPDFPHQSDNKVAFHRFVPYLILVASVALGVGITTYPYALGAAPRLLGSDMWFYDERLNAMMSAANPLSMLEADRALFILILYYIMTLGHLGIRVTLILAPALCSTLLALSAFAFVYEGTRHPWLAGFAALLSVVSAQTSLGMGAGILANWFALSIANFMFALTLRCIRVKSWLACGGSILLSLILLASYTYAWVAAVSMLVITLTVTLLSFRSQSTDQWRNESKFLAVILVAVLAAPVLLAYFLLGPLLGGVPAWINPSAWLNVGWNYLVGRPSAQILESVGYALEQAFDFAGNRIDLPILTILSIVGLVDSIWARSFRRIVAAMVLVPVFLAVVSPDLYLTWRGLYMIPTYLTGALGAESIIRTVNVRRASSTSLSRLAFAGTFAGYIFLTHLSYSLRALELLILAAMFT